MFEYLENLDLGLPTATALIGSLVLMFQPEIKAWLKGVWPSHVEAVYRRAYAPGARSWRRWCRIVMSDARRQALIAQAQETDDVVELARVMTACDPSMPIDMDW